MTYRRTILLVEDDAAIREGVADALELEGYAVLTSADATDGLDRALGGTYDLLLLDLVLPGGDGLVLLEQLRAARPVQPVIIMTARGDEADRVRGLRLGADDYVVKPFSVRELVARVAAVLRRSAERPLDVTTLRLPRGTADLARREVRLDDGACSALSEREVELLRYLAANPGRAVSRSEILQRVWGLSPQYIETRTIDMHVARLREKLGDDGGGRIIRTVRGCGYAWGGEGASA